MIINKNGLFAFVEIKVSIMLFKTTQNNVKLISYEKYIYIFANKHIVII